MSAPAVLPHPPAVRVPSEATASTPKVQKAAADSRPSAYWGDRFTARFWLLCFGLMLGINLVEAVHRFVVYLMEGSPSP